MGKYQFEEAHRVWPQAVLRRLLSWKCQPTEFNKWQLIFPKSIGTVQASFDWLAIAKQFPKKIYHDPCHHVQSPAPATRLLQRLRCCSSRLKSSVCVFFLLTLQGSWLLASSIETPSVIETEWYQLEVNVSVSTRQKPLFHSHANSENFVARENAHKPQLSEARNHASVLRNRALGPLGPWALGPLGPSLLVISKVSQHGDVSG